MDVWPKYKLPVNQHLPSGTDKTILISMKEADYQDRLSHVGRNDLCPCGSGKKYKHCHQPKDEELHHKDNLKLQKQRQAALEKAGEEDTDQQKKSSFHPHHGETGHAHKGMAKGQHVGVHRTTNK